MFRKELLEILKQKPLRRKNLNQFINTLNSRQIRALEYVIRLFLRGKIKVSKHHINKLRRHKMKLRKLVYTKPKSLHQRKKIIAQTGSGIFTLLPAAIAALASLFK